MRFGSFLGRKTWVAGAVALAAVATLFAYSKLGQRARDREVAPLQFEKELADAGTRFPSSRDNHFSAIEVKFPFAVWDRGSVTITKLMSPCERCFRFDQGIVGKELDPGSTHFLLAWVVPYPKTAEVSYQGLVETSPPFSKPKVVEVKCRGIVYPDVFPQQIRLEVVLGEKPEAQLRIAYLRAKSEPALGMKEEVCRLSDFAVTKKDFRTRVDASGAKLLFPTVTDEITLSLRSERDYSLGVHESKWSLKWTGLEPEVEVPVRVEVVHPVRPKVDAVFCGLLQAGEMWRGDVPLLRRDKAKLLLKAVNGSQPFIRGQIAGRDEDRLEIAVHVPTGSAPMRYEESLELVFEDTRYPPLRVPVSFVVAK